MVKRIMILGKIGYNPKDGNYFIPSSSLHKTYGYAKDALAERISHELEFRSEFREGDKVLFKIEIEPSDYSEDSVDHPEKLIDFDCRQ